ncbi:protein-disulfide reductase DsbD domain-containing protein [Roseibium marinum]|uniref:DsbC/DsbD-like thiol-disulfide interchange protein n=1 Tax=Roseibium marinum TaxID=281252 RepID=A0A2S3V4L5_9HYPH|nr:protein-disulfide reductase DsbD domain-containing protein [Roseibium marinum]POF34723.1 DsbC/DsbD-like thiol-disulfide interchange protein [Roseibium marinum]
MNRIALTFSLALLTLASPSRAAMTDWTEVQGGAVRLIASGTLVDGHYQAGLEFLLEPGWHTYWRYPGEAGIPPQITLSGADNLEDLEVLYPVPEHYDDGFSRSIVYHGGIVLPMQVVPEDPRKSVRLAVDVFFGICNEICVPGDASLSLDLDPGSEADTIAAKLIARDLAAVPVAGKNGDLEITSVVASRDRASLVIKARVAGAEAPELFVAGPEGSFIGLPELTGHTDGEALWKLPTRGLAVSDEDSMLRLVLSAGGRAIEHLHPVDPGWVK